MQCCITIPKYSMLHLNSWILLHVAALPFSKCLWLLFSPFFPSLALTASIHFNPTFWHQCPSGTNFWFVLPSMWSVLYKLFHSMFFLKFLFPHPKIHLFIQIIICSYSAPLITLVSFAIYFSLTSINQIYHVFILLWGKYLNRLMLKHIVKKQIL